MVMVTTQNVPLTTRPVSLLMEPEYRVYDACISVVFIIFLIVGVPANILSLIYFLRSKQRILSTWLYIIACSVDIGSSVIHIPVFLTLLNKRAPGVFVNAIFCSVWYFTLLILQQLAMFVVMLLSLTRAIVIIFPFYRVRIRVALASIVGYLIYHVSWNAYYFSYSSVYYSSALAYCTIYSVSIPNLLYQINYNIWSAVPPLIVVVTILVSVYQLRRHSISSASQKRNHYASLTIIYFSLIFLCSNCFSFINNCLYIYTLMRYERYPGPVYNHNFMFFYSWLLSFVFCTVFNAFLNPLLYFWRMKDLRRWIVNLFPKKPSSEIELISVVVSSVHLTEM